MRLLRMAVETKRWDLAAHTLVLATASILKNEDKPPSRRRMAGNPLPVISHGSGGSRVTKTRGREFERKTGCAKRQSKR